MTKEVKEVKNLYMSIYNSNYHFTPYQHGFFIGFLNPVFIHCISLQLKGNYIAALYSMMLTIVQLSIYHHSNISIVQWNLCMQLVLFLFTKTKTKK